ncbi:hypothetical protein LCGC14_0095060 [marine sediment metagenome]|uniref:Uncharacterized protein n=1 Tax=marine sediment metagenome TaxID=412755 RepID=A0A0F9YGP4_9ZZZZ|nr:hypothetical protein [Phycisphaerae bacterium]
MSDKTITPIRKPWKGVMTGRERFNAQMHHQPFDRSVNIEFGYWSENFELWPLFKDNDIVGNHEVDAFFNFDYMDGVWGNCGMHPGFEYEILEDKGDTIISRDGMGLISESPKDGHSTIPHIIDWTVKTPEDWKRVKDEHFNLDDPARIVDIEAYKKHQSPDRDYPLSVACGSLIGNVRDMLTFEGLAFATYDYPEMVEDMVEVRCQLVENFLDQVLGEFDFDFATGWEDICFKQGPIVSVPFFRDIVLPRYKRIGDKLKAAGVDLWHTDCDGDVRLLIPMFLEAGLNIMFPFEVNSSGHPGEMLDKYGPDLRIMGGVDKLELAKGPDAIKAYLETLGPYVAKGGFIPFCDHRCPPDVDPDDYIFYLDLKEEMFGMK